MAAAATGARAPHCSLTGAPGAAFPPEAAPTSGPYHPGMDQTDTTHCARHPGTETRISCVQCGTPICPRCMVDAPVGHKCPDCARQSRHARALGRPEQYAKATAFGVAAAAVAAFVLAFVIGGVGFFTWIVSGVAGYGVAEAVRRGAGGNRADPFRWLGIGLAVVAVLAAWTLAVGGGPVAAVRVLVRNPFNLVTVLAAAYGAFRSLG